GATGVGVVVVADVVVAFLSALGGGVPVILSPLFPFVLFSALVFGFSPALSSFGPPPRGLASELLPRWLQAGQPRRAPPRSGARWFLGAGRGWRPAGPRACNGDIRNARSRARRRNPHTAAGRRFLGVLADNRDDQLLRAAGHVVGLQDSLHLIALQANAGVAVR